MKKQNVILQAAIASALLATFGAANAGTISAPAADSAATVYAAEALTAGTVVTTPSVTYTMGVNRAIGQDFTIIYTPSAGSTFAPASCVGTNFSAAGTGSSGVAFSTKRASASECAIQVSLTSATDTTTTITSSGAFQALTLATHNLNTAGNSVSYTVNLWDLGETARIDNSAALTRVVGTSVNAINVYAAAADTGTVADVNATAGPLMGFVAANGDTATVANAALTIDNNSANAVTADGVTAFDFLTTTGTLSLSVADATKAYAGLAANKFCADFSGATACETGEVFTVTTDTGALTSPAANAGAAVAAFPARGATATVNVTFQADGTSSLGTSRTFAVSGTVNPQVGAAHAFADTANKNATWWTWSANAIELWSPYFSTAPGWISRFAFMNTGTAVGYTATCNAESGNTVANGAAVTGTLTAGMTVINAADVCTFSGNTRGNVRFIINAPAGNIHGAYNLVNATSGSTSISDMTRPFGTVAGTTW